jgi:mediator of RNA polymerase II transcription subunit 16, fungi type
MSDLTIRKAILAIERVNSSTTIAISYGDGSIEFRDRSSMAPIIANEEFNRVSSMPQAGFAFPTDDPCKSACQPVQEGILNTVAGLHTALSPNHCLAIGVDADGEAKLKVMEYTLGSLDTHEGDRKKFLNCSPKNKPEPNSTVEKATAVVIALALQFAISCANHLNNDDLATVIQQCLGPRKLPDWCVP